MKVYASVNVEAYVDPSQFLEQIKIRILKDTNNWIFTENGKYYRGFKTRNFDSKEEITKEKYEAVEAIDKIIKYMEDKKLR